MRSFFLCLTNNFFLLESKNLVFLDFCVVRICFLTYTLFYFATSIIQFSKIYIHNNLCTFFVKELNLSKLNITE